MPLDCLGRAGRAWRNPQDRSQAGAGKNRGRKTVTWTILRGRENHQGWDRQVVRL